MSPRSPSSSAVSSTSSASVAPWWQRGVVYQIYPRSFLDTNGDGVGDLRGIIAQIPYLAWLGVDVVWISPFYPSPMVDFGYDVKDYTDVDPLFGDLATFDALVATARAHGIRVLVDFVPNHTSNEHPWFIESRASRSSAKRDLYVWADARPDGSAPNNWISVFGGSAWQWDEATGQYYLHTFLSEQPDLNWRNPAVAEAMHENMRFWLDRGVGGFRIDAPLPMMKDPEMRDNPASDGQKVFHRPVGDYDKLVPLYNQGHPDIHGIFRGFRRVLDDYGHEDQRVAIGEIHEFHWPTWVKYYGVELDELHMPFNFGLLAIPWNAQTVARLVSEVEASLPQGAWPNYVLGNHDEPRVASRVDSEARARLAMMMLRTLRGTPTIYYGDELGMQNTDIPKERLRDPWELRLPGIGVGRDPGRTPMPWDASPNAGFCPAGVEPWLPMGNDRAQRNVDVQKDDPRSLLTLTRALLVLRRETAALSGGIYRALREGEDDCFAFLREAGDERCLIALNFADTPRTLSLSGITAGEILASTHPDAPRGQRALDMIHLRGDEGLVVRLA
ncbi:MAG TPA: alpha-amylase family glycosyl hydrolase [Polyangiaceae bacterium]|nr:alpha-amylase family glycosyl hydrolase [Polyangiaceae bacterium]